MRTLIMIALQWGGCGSHRVPFKVTCAAYSYTVVGKGTTSQLWEEVLCKAEIYWILWCVQGPAVPVFLGRIDLAQVYFLHGTGEIHHMLLMGWGGDSVGCIKHDENIQHAISHSEKEIFSLGVFHQDLQPENILWIKDLKQALIINSHQCILDHQPIHQQSRSLKRLLSGTKEWEVKWVCVVRVLSRRCCWLFRSFAWLPVLDVPFSLSGLSESVYKATLPYFFFFFLFLLSCLIFSSIAT